MPQIGATISEELKAEIQELADTHDRSFSQMVEILLKDSVAAWKVKKFRASKTESNGK
jgi:hypothetical protein